MDIISPLQYCELRGEHGDPCDTFASAIVEGLPCCKKCAVRLLTALEDGGVNLVTRLEAIEKKEELP